MSDSTTVLPLIVHECIEHSAITFCPTTNYEPLRSCSDFSEHLITARTECERTVSAVDSSYFLYAAAAPRHCLSTSTRTTRVNVLVRLYMVDISHSHGSAAIAGNCSWELYRRKHMGVVNGDAEGENELLGVLLLDRTCVLESDLGPT